MTKDNDFTRNSLSDIYRVLFFINNHILLFELIVDLTINTIYNNIMELEIHDGLTLDQFSVEGDLAEFASIADKTRLDLIPLTQANLVSLSYYVQSLVDHYNQQILALNIELEEIKNKLNDD